MEFRHAERKAYDGLGGAGKQEICVTIPEVQRLAQDFLGTALLIALPALVVSLVVGLIVSIVQTITSIQDQTLSFVPRLIAVGGVLLLCLGWILHLAVQFTMRMFECVAGVVQ